MTLKQKVRKYNKDFETEIQAFRENPVDSDEDQTEPGEAYQLNYMYIVVVTSVILITIQYSEFNFFSRGAKQSLLFYGN